MRTLSSTLEAAQKAAALNKLYKIVLTKGATTYTYDKTRILPSSHDEGLYSHKAEIVLKNHDDEFDEKDLKGFKGVISYGALTSAGEEYSATAPLWARDQQFDSDPNKLNCTLVLRGAFDLMADDQACQSYIPGDDDDNTVKDLVDDILGATLDCFAHCQSFDVVWDTGYDDLADTYKPKGGFRVYVGGNRLAALRRLLDYTSNVARWEDDGKIHILKPVTSGETYDSEYGLSKSDHKFFSKAYKNTLVIPNRVYVISYEDDDPQYLGVASTSDYASLPDELKKIQYVQAKLESNDEADNIAEALIAKAEMGSSRGQAVVPLNVGSEAFDYVKVTDSRQGDTRTGNLGYVHRRFGIDKWTMTFGFGNWFEYLKYQKTLKELEVYTGQYFERLNVGNLYAEKILTDSLDIVWIDPDGNIDLSAIGDNLDNLPDGETYARVKSLHLDAGGIKIDENIIYAGGYDPSTKWTGSDLDDLPDGETYQRVKSAALTAEGLVILDQVTVGTYGLVKSTDISAGHIRLSYCVGDLDDIDDGGSYEKVKATDISAGHVRLSYCVGDLDDIDNGSSYAKLRTTDIESGHIKLSSYTEVSGEWYNESGVEIDASHGINIYGQNNALTTRATKTGTIQCYVGSNGNIYAGGGNVRIGSSGISITGSGELSFLYGASYRGYIDGESSWLHIKSSNVGLELEAASGYELRLKSSALINMQAQYVDLPSRSSNPTGTGGRLYYNTSTTKLMVYAEGAWRSFQLT